MPEYYVSWSGGADSTATALLALEHREPLTSLVYCEVMFDEHISGEVPEHAEFIHGTAIPWFKNHGVQIEVLRSQKTFCDYFYWPITKGRHIGKLHGFPLTGAGRCSIKRDCKLPPLRAFIRQHKDATWYLGIAADEERRLKSMGHNAVSLLEKYHITQVRAREICKRYGLLSPSYQFTTRGRCFFCPNANETELRHLRDYHPNLWKKLLKLGSIQNVARPNSFSFDLSLNDYENNFDFDDRQITWDDLVKEET